MIYRTYQFICDDCFAHQLFIGGITDARRNGWAIGRNRQDAYCPNCAPSRRNVGLSKSHKR